MDSKVYEEHRKEKKNVPQGCILENVTRTLFCDLFTHSSKTTESQLVRFEGKLSNHVSLV